MVLLMAWACASPAPGIAQANKPRECFEFKFIHPARQHDTAETLEQIDENNAVWTKLCGK